MKKFPLCSRTGKVSLVVSHLLTIDTRQMWSDRPDLLTASTCLASSKMFQPGRVLRGYYRTSQSLRRGQSAGEAGQHMQLVSEPCLSCWLQPLLVPTVVLDTWHLLIKSPIINK